MPRLEGFGSCGSHDLLLGKTLAGLRVKLSEAESCTLLLESPWENHHYSPSKCYMNMRMVPNEAQDIYLDTHERNLSNSLYFWSKSHLNRPQFTWPSSAFKDVQLPLMGNPEPWGILSNGAQGLGAILGHRQSWVMRQSWAMDDHMPRTI